MQRSRLFAASLISCFLTTTVAQALTMGYGRRDVEQAGTGCVGGWISDHGNVAYFQGDTKLLNQYLVSLATAAEGHSVARVVLHTGAKVVDDPEEKPQTGLGGPADDSAPARLRVDWSVQRYCPSDDILTGDCRCDRRLVTLDVWIANDIHLDSLAIPPGLKLESGRELDTFIKRHRARE